MFGGISEFRCRFNQFKRIILSSNHSPSGFGCFLIFFSFVRQKKKQIKFVIYLNVPYLICQYTWNADVITESNVYRYRRLFEY